MKIFRRQFPCLLLLPRVMHRPWTLLTVLLTCSMLLLAPAAPVEAGHDDIVGYTDAPLVALNSYWIPADRSVIEQMPSNESDSETVFEVVFNPPTCFGTVTEWEPAARSAFEHALDIWGGLLKTQHSIRVHACWRTDMGSSNLGSASQASNHSNFSGAILKDTNYPAALANAVSGSDLNDADGFDRDRDGHDADVEIWADFNSATNWYFGTDGQTPKDQHDFVSVVLHELAHGLGMTGDLTVENGMGKWPNEEPAIYDRFTTDADLVSLLDTSIYPNNSLALAEALQSGLVTFNGSQAKQANGQLPVPLYAPNPYQSGSSYTHLDDYYNDTAHALMTHDIGPGESIHHPGWVTLGLFHDMGWTIKDDGGPAPSLLARPAYAALPESVEVTATHLQEIRLLTHRSDAAWTASSTSAWLSVAPQKSSGMQNVMLTADTSGLPPGYYAGRVTFALDAESGTQTIVEVPLIIAGEPDEPLSNLLENGDMEQSDGWTESSTNQLEYIILQITVNGTNIARSGSQVASLGGEDNDVSDLAQTIDLPEQGPIRLVYYTLIDSHERCGYDWAEVRVNDAAVSQHALCSESAHDEWRLHILDLDEFAGQTIALAFHAETDSSAGSFLYIDDVALYGQSKTDPEPDIDEKVYLPTVIR